MIKTNLSRPLTALVAATELQAGRRFIVCAADVQGRFRPDSVLSVPERFNGETEFPAPYMTRQEALLEAARANALILAGKGQPRRVWWLVVEVGQSLRQADVAACGPLHGSTIEVNESGGVESRAVLFGARVVRPTAAEAKRTLHQLANMTALDWEQRIQAELAAVDREPPAAFVDTAKGRGGGR